MRYVDGELEYSFSRLSGKWYRLGWKWGINHQRGVELTLEHIQRAIEYLDSGDRGRYQPIGVPFFWAEWEMPILEDLKDWAA